MKKINKTIPVFLFKIMVCLVMLFFSVRVLVSQEGGQMTLPENPLKGSQVFIEKGCFNCHTVMRVGEAFGPDLTSIGREKNLYGLAGALWSHSPKMLEIMKEKNIQRPELTPLEAEELIAYIYFQGFFDEHGDPRQGEEIYLNKGCIQCHSLGDERQKVGPSLDKFGRYISPVFIASALWNHSSTVSSAMVGQSFAPQEMSHLLAYIKENAANPEGETLYMEPGNPSRGQDVFLKKRCQVCHGSKGESLEKSLLRRSLTEIVGMMWNHSNVMWSEMRERGLNIPSFDNIEMADVVAYLYFIPYYGTPGDQVSGRKVFEEKGCISCHSQESDAEKENLDLKSVSQDSVFELISAMWNHVPEMEKMVTEFNLIWPKFDEKEMKDLIQYIRSLQ